MHPGAFLPGLCQPGLLLSERELRTGHQPNPLNHLVGILSRLVNASSFLFQITSHLLSLSSGAMESGVCHQGTVGRDCGFREWQIYLELSPALGSPLDTSCSLPFLPLPDYEMAQRGDPWAQQKLYLSSSLHGASLPLLHPASYGYNSGTGTSGQWVWEKELLLALSASH